MSFTGFFFSMVPKEPSLPVFWRPIASPVETSILETPPQGTGLSYTVLDEEVPDDADLVQIGSSSNLTLKMSGSSVTAAENAIIRVRAKKVSGSRTFKVFAADVELTTITLTTTYTTYEISVAQSLVDAWDFSNLLIKITASGSLVNISWVQLQMTPQ